MTDPLGDWTRKSLTGHAAIRRGLAASAAAVKRLEKAKSKGEKVRAAIEYAAVLQTMGAELYDRDQTTKEIIALIDSDTSLDREDRRDLGRQLRGLLFPDPIEARRRRRYAKSYECSDADHLKQFLRGFAGLSALEAEQEVASYFGVSVEALKMRKKRAKKATLP